MSDGQTEACEANGHWIDWSKPLEYHTDSDKLVPLEFIWQNDEFIVLRLPDEFPFVLRKHTYSQCRRYRNALSPPQYRPFTKEELPDLVGRRFRRKLEPSEIGLATLSSRGAMSIGGWKFGAEAILDELELDDNGQWVPAGVRL